jgi:hypothetical protein
MDYLGKNKFSLTAMQTNLCTNFEQNKHFVHMEDFWDLLFQLMKHQIKITFYLSHTHG